MNSVVPFPPAEPLVQAGPEESSQSLFMHAPMGIARCDSDGMIDQMNPAFVQSLDPAIGYRKDLRLEDCVAPVEREHLKRLLHDLFNSRRDNFAVQVTGASESLIRATWTVWRESGSASGGDYAWVMSQPSSGDVSQEETRIQTQRWDTVGRMTGGVAHDFNNLLTGVMLYCDLLLSALDPRDRRRRYADEIRSAIIQASGLVQQLLVFARPPAARTLFLSFNDIASGMRDLLSRLIGENIQLELNLDPELGHIKIDQAQAQQILLNLILNARDALPSGGRILVETRNCRFQPIAASQGQSDVLGFPCVLLVVGDNGIGMDAETRRRLFEPFFTTKNAGKGTGLGLTTVRSIVTTNQGLIHFESEPGQGTRVMILFPHSLQNADSIPPDTQPSISEFASVTPFQHVKKEAHL